MEYYMTLAACKLYKGEKECPYKRNDKRIVFWNYEKWACKADLKTTRADVREIEEDAKRFGIYDDINYIANINDLDNGFLFILLGRYLHWSGFYTKESLKEGFFKWIDIYVKC